LKYYIVLTSSTAERITKESLEPRTVPRSDLKLLAQSLNASFLIQESYPIKFIDRIRAQFSGTPENWAFARALAAQLGPDDVVFCPGEEIGIPLASVCSAKKERPKIAVWFHRIAGLKSRVALKIFNIANSVDLFLVITRPNQNFLCRYLNLSDSQVHFFWHSIDCDFFKPGTVSSNKTRPIVASVGLERRDYMLLAAATEELDVSVKVSGFSQFQSRIARTFPQPMPKNMSNEFYELPDLIQLYRDADVVAVCLKQSLGAAGLTAVLEAMCFKKPIVAVRTKGLTDYLSDEQAIISVEPGDAVGLKKAILYLLNNPQEAKLRAERAYQLVLERHNLEKQVEFMATLMRTLAG
jgi:glycosyltransferase involved in cell wall biosynthesis